MRKGYAGSISSFCTSMFPTLALSKSGTVEVLLLPLSLYTSSRDVPCYHSMILKHRQCNLIYTSSSITRVIMKSAYITFFICGTILYKEVSNNESKSSRITQGIYKEKKCV